MTETPNRKSTRTVLIILGVLLLLLLCACVAVLGANWAFRSRGRLNNIIDISRIGNQVEERFEREAVFEVDTPVVLELTGDVGSIHVIGTEGNEVRVEAVIRGYGSTQAEAREAMESVNVEITQVADNHIRLIGDNPDRPQMGKSPTVTWTVRVPRQAQLQVSNGVGDVRIEKITGSMQVTSDVGDVIVKGFTLTDDSQFTTDVGSISVSLPRNSAFALNAVAHVGKVKSAFHPAAEQGGAVTGVVGDNPRGTLTARADVGSITIERE